MWYSGCECGVSRCTTAVTISIVCDLFLVKTANAQFCDDTDSATAKTIGIVERKEGLMHAGCKAAASGLQ